MKISLEWLREYVDYPGTPQELSRIYTDIGFPVEDLQQIGNDWMLDVEITSNRPDCLGHIGLARELAAAAGATFKMPAVDFPETATQDVSQLTAVDNQAPDLCNRYTARVIEDVTVAPSPDWMIRRLETIGLRGISNVVDITNYVLMEIGQPLHSFDFDKLNEHRIVVRRAKPGEQMETIDHTKVELNDNMLVIADATEPVALAGVMGGLPSEVTDSTKNILLESAHFNPLSIRSTSRALTVSSEASFCFERNVDIEMTEWASRRATALLVELTGGKVAPGLIDSWPVKHPAPPITLRLGRVKTLLGIDIPTERVLNILSQLQLQPQLDKATATITCTAPSWRKDLRREVDLIEETIRIEGYNTIPTEHDIQITVKTQDNFQRACGLVTAALNGCGYFETVNVSFLDENTWQPFVAENFQPVRVKDAARKANNALRPTLLPSLLTVRKRNQDAGNDRCDLYELSAVHQPGDNRSGVSEAIKLALLTDSDFRELRGVIEATVKSLDKNALLTCKPAELPWAEKGTGAELVINGQAIGYAGKAAAEIIKLFDLEQDLALAEIDFEPLTNLQSESYQIKPLTRYPSVTRDLSLVLAEDISWQQIDNTISELDLPDLQELTFVDIYRGKGVEAGCKSLTLSMVFRNPEQTLTHEEVDGYQEKILKALGENLNAQLRA
ncbi:MAG: phenylalanine--tRNA ligase subunit beta [Sedimentisphaerales bacterium]|nr:phenylalanine--tRNA ligase subunit beta [Sedimentisphaerales bacterium]